MIVIVFATVIVLSLSLSLSMDPSWDRSEDEDRSWNEPGWMFVSADHGLSEEKLRSMSDTNLAARCRFAEGEIEAWKEELKRAEVMSGGREKNLVDVFKRQREKEKEKEKALQENKEEKEEFGKCWAEELGKVRESETEKETKSRKMHE